MLRITTVTIAATLLAMSGCYAPQSLRKSTSYGSYAPASEAGGGATADRSAPAAPRGAPPAPTAGRGATIPPPAPGAYRHRRAPTRRIVRPTYRPGLATVFGERVRSRVRFTSFQRASTRPSGVVSIHYNDYAGLRAMTRHLRRRCCSTLSPYRVRAGVTVQLTDSLKRPLSGVQLAGRTIVLGRAGTRYGILVKNHSAQRFEVVGSVDGLDVIDGKRASTAKRGYVLPPYGTVFIRGFRTSRYNVAAFRFGTVAASYAARTGSARNVGVVGVAVFSEYRAPANAEVIKRLRAQPFAQPPR